MNDHRHYLSPLFDPATVLVVCDADPQRDDWFACLVDGLRKAFGEVPVHRLPASRDESPREIIAAGFPEAEVRRTVGMLKRNEYKRRQSPVGIRVTQRGFGKDWRYPITSRYQDEF